MRRAHRCLPFDHLGRHHGSGAGTTSHTVTGLTAGTEYTFEVRAVNGEGNGAEASVTATLLAPTWEFTLTDSSGDPVTELTEGGDPATATVKWGTVITNSVTGQSSSKSPTRR